MSHGSMKKIKVEIIDYLIKLKWQHETISLIAVN